MATPAATYVLGALGGLALLRGLWHSHRALVKAGSVGACAGTVPGGCSPELSVTPSEKPATVYAVGRGRVASAGPGWVHIAVANEPVILCYTGVAPSVEADSHVGRGQPIGVASATLGFSVWELVGGKLLPVEPASWLAARGYRIADSLASAADHTLWCEEARHLVIPKPVHGPPCNLRNPAAAGFALLPVSIEQA